MNPPDLPSRPAPRRQGFPRLRNQGALGRGFCSNRSPVGMKDTVYIIEALLALVVFLGFLIAFLRRNRSGD